MTHVMRISEMQNAGNRGDEFTYGDSADIGRGKHRQVIFYKKKPVGYLMTKEKNRLAPLEETYLLPDAERGLKPGSGLAVGKKGWIEFRKFGDYDEALQYASENFEKLAYLFKYGDCD